MNGRIDCGDPGQIDTCNVFRSDGPLAQVLLKGVYRKISNQREFCTAISVMYFFEPDVSAGRDTLVLSNDKGKR